MTSKDAAAVAAATAQPPTRPTFEVGSHIEVRMEQGQPYWADLEVLEAHGGHVYTLLADLAAMEGDETEGEDLVRGNEEQAVEEAEGEQHGSPAAAAPGASAGDGGSSEDGQAGGGSAAAAAARAEAQAAPLQRLQARVVSESALVFQWTDGGETTHEWRPAAANLQVMFKRSLEKMAETASIPASVAADMPLASMAAAAAASLEIFVRRTVACAEAAGTREISADLVHRMMGEVAAEMGLPPPPLHGAKRQRR